MTCGVGVSASGSGGADRRGPRAGREGVLRAGLTDGPRGSGRWARLGGLGLGQACWFEAGSAQLVGLLSFFCSFSFFYFCFLF